MKNYSFPTKKEIADVSKHVLRRKNKDTKKLEKASLGWIRAAWENKLDYEVSWLGMTIIQNPYDMILMQELIFDLRPDLIVETGIAHGGSLIYYASLMEMLGKGRVIGVDIDIRSHNRCLIEKHPMYKRIEMIQGGSTDKELIARLKKKAKKYRKVMVCLDSHHGYEHVLKELRLYAPLVSKGSYIVVFDTLMPKLFGLKGTKNIYSDYRKDNPGSAAKKFLSENKNFKIDKNYNKFFVSSCPDGFLRRIK
ncbi:MAG: class I SAM-dependent methyltransferase [Candidatus Liptonbacteria bacterium]|nr:class I SAM-dependent methyltransferase [Parcubacteria group bacterium]MBI4087351.1 class I SAM-dependent methyltransferase [Candidatus Liptonbacteria bacterium]